MSESYKDFTIEELKQRKKELEIERLELEIERLEFENECIQKGGFKGQDIAKPKKGSGLATASLVFGILSLLSFWICGVLAIAFAQTVLKDPDSSFGGYGRATSGKIMGIIGVVLSSLALMVFYAWYGIFGLLGLLGLLAGGSRPIQHRLPIIYKS